MNTLEKRLSTIEGKLIPKLSEYEEQLCQNAWFVALLKDEGLDVGDLKLTGSVFGSMPYATMIRLRDQFRQVIGGR